MLQMDLISNTFFELDSNVYHHNLSLMLRNDNATLMFFSYACSYEIGMCLPCMSPQSWITQIYVFKVMIDVFYKSKLEIFIFI